MSTNTKTGAFPPCAAAKSSIVFTTLPVRSQSAGVLNSPPIIITVGSLGGGWEANPGGGWEPNPGGGWEPNPGGGWEANPGGGWEANQAGGR